MCRLNCVICNVAVYICTSKCKAKANSRKSTNVGSFITFQTLGADMTKRVLSNAGHVTLQLD
jgi:hypothetical protein